MSRLFEARYSGRCPMCDKRFEAGDMVGFVDEGELCCESCHTGVGGSVGMAALQRSAPKTEKPCPECFMIHAGDCL